MSAAAILDEARRFVAGARDCLHGDGRVQILSSATATDRADDDTAGLAQLLGAYVRCVLCVGVYGSEAAVD